MDQDADTPQQRQGPRPTGVLTGYELLVLQLAAQGYSHGQMANLLSLSDEGVAVLERSACAALGARGAREAVEEARRRGLIL